MICSFCFPWFLQINMLTVKVVIIESNRFLVIWCWYWVSISFGPIKQKMTVFPRSAVGSFNHLLKSVATTHDYCARCLLHKVLHIFLCIACNGISFVSVAHFSFYSNIIIPRTTGFPARRFYSPFASCATMIKLCYFLIFLGPWKHWYTKYRTSTETVEKNQENSTYWHRRKHTSKFLIFLKVSNAFKPSFIDKSCFCSAKLVQAMA